MEMPPGEEASWRGGLLERRPLGEEASWRGGLLERRPLGEEEKREEEEEEASWRDEKKGEGKKGTPQNGKKIN